MCWPSSKAPTPQLVADTPPVEEAIIDDPENLDEETDVSKKGITSLTIPLGAGQGDSGIFIPGGG